jgi:hypothetical protein
MFHSFKFKNWRTCFQFAINCAAEFSHIFKPVLEIVYSKFTGDKIIAVISNLLHKLHH